MSTEVQTIPRPRDAILFIPGLSAFGGVNQSGQSIAQRIAVALDRNAATLQAQFPVRTGEQEKYQLGNGTGDLQVSTIYRKDGNKVEPVMDLYALNLDENLLRNYQHKSAAVVSLRLLLASVLNTGNFIRACLPTRRAKTGREKLQLVVIVLVAILLASYLLILLAAVAETVTQLLQRVPQLLQWVPELLPPGFMENGLPVLPQAVVLAVAALEVLFPNTMRNLKEMIAQAATYYLGAIDYISLGGRKDAIVGQVGAALQHICGKEDKTYRHFHLMGFSFGSLIALDCLFQPGSAPPRQYSAVHTLVTIGCPYDLIRLIWPAYFSGRRGLPGEPDRWINIYSPTDILGSNFRDDDAHESPDMTILEKGLGLERPVVQNLKFIPGAGFVRKGALSTLMLGGLWAHASYWSVAGFEAERSCFDQLVEMMYEGDPVLA